jgi:hypothetical protein
MHILVNRNRLTLALISIAKLLENGNGLPSPARNRRLPFPAWALAVAEAYEQENREGRFTRAYSPIGFFKKEKPF